MKRVILRVRDGVVCVSANYRVKKAYIDEFVASKSAWIEEQLKKPPIQKPVMKDYDDNICLEKFEQLADNVFPLVKHKLKTKPQMRVKNYKSRWGVCYATRGYIILNKQLFDRSDRAIEQVILHEYVHLIVPNHGAKFHKIMAELMPDYKERSKELKLVR